ncbi:MAG: glycosyltransferase family 9 protein [Raineya sp.]|nr:glycosyltransferase family 9 protein [Raineya sp.]MDW8296229.1 glycosyltransferase family 9 protein [Raineya sp.]
MRIPTIQKNEIRKILIIHYGAIGDFIAGTIAFKALRDSFPNARITLLSRANTFEICPPGSLVDEYIVFDEKNKKTLWKIFWQIRKKAFDAVVNLKDFSEVMHLITFFSGAKIRAGLGRGIWSKVYTHLPPNYTDTNQHEYLKNLSVARTLGAENPHIQAYVHITNVHKEATETFWQENNLVGSEVLAVVPGASDFRKAWRSERFVEIINKFLKTYDSKVLLVWGSEAEKSLVENMAKSVQNTNLIILPRGSVGWLASVLKKTKVCLCNNSGVMHIAYAVDTPVICLNTSISWQAFGEKGYNVNAFGKDIQNNKYLPIEQVRILLDTISVEEVWKILQKVWEKF